MYLGVDFLPQTEIVMKIVRVCARNFFSELMIIHFSIDYSLFTVSNGQTEIVCEDFEIWMILVSERSLLVLKIITRIV